MPSCRALALVILLTSHPVWADAPAPRATRPIAQLIAELDDDRFLVRDEATRLLLARGAEARAPLEQALANDPSPELKARARFILEALSVDAEKPVDGLQLRLHTDADQVRPGSSVHLTTTLANSTNKDLNVQVGFSTCGNYFQTGANLRVLDAAGNTGKVHWLVDLCGTGAGPIFVTVPARGRVEFVTRMRLEVDEDRLLYSSKLVTVAAPRRGTHRLCMVLSATAGQQGLPSRGTPPANPKARYWIGELRSNIVELQVVH